MSSRLRILDCDPWLEPYERDLRARHECFNRTSRHIVAQHGSLREFASGHLYFGFHETPEGWYYREWAPAAHELYLVGDFNNWDRRAHPLHRVGQGAWEIFLPRAQYENTFVHGSCVKVHVVSDAGAHDRIPLYIRRVYQYPNSANFAGQLWFPKTKFQWTDASYEVNRVRPLMIYESHVGMAQDREGLGTYVEFADAVLPRIVKAGYTAVQLMAIQEHPYYGSFGYHVSNFFAASSRFGTPEDLKYLINKAHSLGVAVLLDIVHSHAVKNFNEGIGSFDGTVHQFFHEGEKGEHPAWDSKLFDYGNMGVCHFLLSNVRFWLEEYHFDGFRFDGVTSMLYHHHGLGHAFSHYGKYFSMDTDTDAVLYLQMANAVAREVRPDVVTVAEDMSGMPGMCIPIADGGIGFDYRLAMGVPDFWIKTLRAQRDEDWNMHTLWHELTTRRPHEKNIGYAESHDQALVGDKTIAFWLMDAAMYWHMHEKDNNLLIERGMALHKMIRLVTLALAGEGYLNFMGNEFGHPEWIDFPREGNGWSYKYARRQWNLVDNPDLKFKFLAEFDRCMMHLAVEKNIPLATDLQQLWICEERKLLVFRKSGLLFAFNFHPSNSIPDFEFFVESDTSYRVILNSDAAIFGGLGRVTNDVVYTPRRRKGGTEWPPFALKTYLPCRSAIVFGPAE
jgi:1,4-alpha-glucan branching enzyme